MLYKNRDIKISHRLIACSYWLSDKAIQNIVILCFYFSILDSPLNSFNHFIKSMITIEMEPFSSMVLYIPLFYFRYKVFCNHEFFIFIFLAFDWGLSAIWCSQEWKCSFHIWAISLFCNKQPLTRSVKKKIYWTAKYTPFICDSSSSPDFLQSILFSSY